jgi:hypothetical protein
LALEGGPGAPGERLLVRGVDVAEQPGHPAALVVIGQDAEGVEVGLEQHVRLFDPHEPLDGRPVEHDLAAERLLELAARHFDVLVDAEDVGELEAEEIHPEAAGQGQHIVLPRTAQVGWESFQTRPVAVTGRPGLGRRHGIVPRDGE